MNITRNNLEKSIVELIVEESVENIAKARKDAIKHLQENAEIKGFRKWVKIPENVIIRQYSEEHINRMAIDFSIDKMYKDSLRKEKLVPVAQWIIKEIISESPLIIKIHIEVLPNVEIDSKYKKISLKKEDIKVEESEINNAVSEIERKFTKFEECNEKKSEAALWDKLTIDTEWYEWGKLLDNTSMQDYPLILWTNILVPWFEEQLVWSKLWDVLELPIEFPNDYHNPDFANKKTTFKVTVKKIEKAVKPEFTPEFIEQLRGKKLNFEEFKDLIKEEIKETKESNARIKEESELVDELLKITKVDIWDSLLNNQIKKVFWEIKQNMAQDNIKMSDYLESLKLDEDEYKEKHVKEAALKRLQWELILHKLWELEKTEVTNEELNSEIEKIISKFQNPDVLKRLKELYVEWSNYYEELRQRMIYRKLIDSFFNK